MEDGIIPGNPIIFNPIIFITSNFPFFIFRVSVGPSWEDEELHFLCSY